MYVPLIRCRRLSRLRYSPRRAIFFGVTLHLNSCFLPKWQEESGSSETAHQCRQPQDGGLSESFLIDGPRSSGVAFSQI